MCCSSLHCFIRGQCNQNIHSIYCIYSVLHMLCLIIDKQLHTDLFHVVQLKKLFRGGCHHLVCLCVTCQHVHTQSLTRARTTWDFIPPPSINDQLNLTGYCCESYSDILRFTSSVHSFSFPSCDAFMVPTYCSCSNYTSSYM